MANPVKFPQSNDLLRRPSGMTEDQCADLPIWRGVTAHDMATPMLISCWELSPEEMEQINRTGKIYVGAIGQTHPPIFIITEFPELVPNPHVRN